MVGFVDYLRMMTGWWSSPLLPSGALRVDRVSSDASLSVTGYSVGGLEVQGASCDADQLVVDGVEVL